MASFMMFDPAFTSSYARRSSSSVDGEPPVRRHVLDGLPEPSNVGRPSVRAPPSRRWASVSVLRPGDRRRSSRAPGLRRSGIRCISSSVSSIPISATRSSICRQSTSLSTGMLRRVVCERRPRVSVKALASTCVRTGFSRKSSMPAQPAALVADSRSASAVIARMQLDGRGRSWRLNFRRRDQAVHLGIWQSMRTRS